VISVNAFDPKGMKIGTVGRILDFPGYELRIASDGEILFKGPNLMKGYYKREDLTKEAIDEQGWFHTGDIGEIDNGGFLKITDRKKEMFKTSGGKYIAPQVLENMLKASPFIEQVCVVGEYRKFPGLLLIPSFEMVRKYLGEIGVKAEEKNEALICQSEVINKLQTEIDKINANLAQWEKIKKFALLPREFTIDAGEITPKLSLRRKAIEKRYSEQIEGMYSEAD
jgi:long-chain acyl-CoA synthetase